MGESKIYPIRIWGDLADHIEQQRQINEDMNVSEYCRQLMRRGAGLGSALPPMAPPVQEYEMQAIGGIVVRTEKEVSLDELEANLDNIEF